MTARLLRVLVANRRATATGVAQAALSTAADDPALAAFVPACAARIRELCVRAPGPTRGTWVWYVRAAGAAAGGAADARGRHVVASTEIEAAGHTTERALLAAALAVEAAAGGVPPDATAGAWAATHPREVAAGEAARVAVRGVSYEVLPAPHGQHAELAVPWPPASCTPESLSYETHLAALAPGASHEYEFVMGEPSGCSVPLRLARSPPPLDGGTFTVSVPAAFHMTLRASSDGGLVASLDALSPYAPGAPRGRAGRDYARLLQLLAASLRLRSCRCARARARVPPRGAAAARHVRAPPPQPPRQHLAAAAAAPRAVRRPPRPRGPPRDTRAPATVLRARMARVQPESRLNGRAAASRGRTGRRVAAAGGAAAGGGRPGGEQQQQLPRRPVSPARRRGGRQRAGRGGAAGVLERDRRRPRAALRVRVARRRRAAPGPIATAAPRARARARARTRRGCRDSRVPFVPRPRRGSVRCVIHRTAGARARARARARTRAWRRLTPTQCRVCYRWGLALLRRASRARARARARARSPRHRSRGHLRDVHHRAREPDCAGGGAARGDRPNHRRRGVEETLGARGASRVAVRAGVCRGGGVRGAAGYRAASGGRRKQWRHAAATARGVPRGRRGSHEDTGAVRARMGARARLGK